MEKTGRTNTQTYFAVCPSGAEGALSDELTRGRYGRPVAQKGGALFSGPPSEGWRAVLNLRTAVRVYREVGRYPSGNEDALYKGALALPWETLMTPQTTFAVDSRVTNPLIKHSGFATLRIKDAIVDRLRQKYGERPSVDTKNPMVRVFAHIGQKRTAISLDLGGKPLNKRGYRLRSVEAPVTETLAACAVDYSGWDMRAPFLDPFCGSGTIVIEAAMKALNIPPGLINPDFAFRNLPDFDAGRWEEMLSKAREAIKPVGKLIIIGSDIDAKAVEAAKANAQTALVGDAVKIEQRDIKDFSPKPGWGATLLSNPPYGLRIEAGENPEEFFHELGQVLLNRCKGYNIHLFLPEAKYAKAMMLKPDSYRPLFHGGLEARLYKFTVR